MKRTVLIALTALMVGGASVAHAQEDLVTEDRIGGTFSVNVGFVTEYFFRGISQSGNGNPAVQGGFDFEHDTGLYTGIWGSSINFGGNLETDFYGGWTGEIDDSGIGLDVGAIYYVYPKSSAQKLDFWEGYVGVGKDFDLAEAAVKFSYSPEWTGRTDEAYYLKASLDIPAGRYLVINLHGGRQWFDNNTKVGFDDYYDWLVGLSFKVFGFDSQLARIGTNLPKAQCTASCDRFVFGVSRTF